MEGTALHSASQAEDHARYVSRLMRSHGVIWAVLAAHCSMLAAAWWATHDPVYLGGVALLVALAFVRTSDMRRFERACGDGPPPAKEAKRWEYRYSAGAFASAAVTGAAAGYALVVGAGTAAVVATLGVSMAALVSVVGRGFGSRAVVDLSVLALCLPLAAGMALSGDPYVAVLALAVIPLAAGVRSMAAAVRRKVASAYGSRRAAHELAAGFSAALDSMPSGLVMTDPQGRVTVVNGRAAALFGLGAEDAFKGRPLAVVVRFMARRCGFGAGETRDMAARLESLNCGASARELVSFPDGRTFDVTGAVREGGGIVLNFDDVTQRVEQESSVRRLATYDSLSGLPNRTHMAELVKAAVAGMADGESVVFAVMDIDRFKYINDTYGHQAGDRVISFVGARMQEACGPGMVAARLGGDEFVLAVTGVRTGDDVASALDAFFASVSDVCLVRGKKLEVTISGGAVVCERDGFDLDEALVKADLALYESKKSEATCWTLFEREMDRTWRDRQALAADLREALVSGGIEAVYQPVMSSDGVSVVAFEALARWNHPVRGPVSPSVFIPLAEQVGAVGEITKRVLEAACRECAGWAGDVSVSVNLSAIDISNPSIVDVIRDCLRRTGLAAHRLQVEVTETSVVEDRAKSGRVLAAIRELGVKTALDDFGVGYSSFGYLHEFALDRLKIDRAFVERIEHDDKARRVLRAMIRLGSDIGFGIVVEGVERPAQLEIVRGMGSVLIQGYIFGKPMPALQVADFVAEVAGRFPASVTPLSEARRRAARA